MLPSKRINRLFRRLARRLSWPAMLFLVIAQTALTYFFFYLAGESDLVNHPLEFFYYNMVVVSFPVIQFIYNKLSKAPLITTVLVE